MAITDISGGFRQRITLLETNIDRNGGLIHNGLVSRADVQALLDHAKANNPNYEAARRNYEFRLVRAGNDVFLDLKTRSFMGRLKARLHIGNERARMNARPRLRRSATASAWGTRRSRP